ncbi:penicillin-binding protein A [Mycobacterium xenopi 3993]|nr:penicillin-binding protein A [Mycobacterium xenopi 3993]
MNASLRRVSVTVMALIVLLLLNATFTQVFTADGLRADPRNQRVLLDEYSRQRGQITAGGQLLAYSVATDNRYKFLRVYPNPFVYAPITGFYSLRYSSTGLERAEDPLLNGSDERLFGRRLADFFTGRDPRGGNVDTTINPRVQQAGWDAMQQGCGGPAKGRWWRWSRRQARSWRWCPHRPMTPTSWRRTIPTNSCGRGSGCATTRPPADQPRDRRDLPTGIDLQGDHHRGCPAGRDDRGRPADFGADNSAARQHRHAAEFRRRAVWQRADGVAARGLRPVLQHRVRAVGHRHRRRRVAQHCPGVRVRHCPDPIPLQVAESTVGPIVDAAALGMSSIGQKDVALTPLQNAVVAATIANAGVTMQPYLVNSLQGPDLANISSTAPHQQRRAVSPQVAAKLTELMVGAESVTQQKGPSPACRSHPRPVPQSTAPTRVTLHHMRGTSPSHRRTCRRWPSRYWWRTALTDYPRLVAPSPRRSDAP